MTKPERDECLWRGSAGCGFADGVYDTEDYELMDYQAAIVSDVAHGLKEILRVIDEVTG